MQFSLELGRDQKNSIEYQRHWFSGRTTININGDVKTLKDPFQLSTHFDLEFTKRWEFAIETPEPAKLVVEEIRPVFFGGCQPHQYNVYVDDSLVLEKCGY
ncbi:hypothetical protein [Gimesia panareensis]|uniref:hypothetical protein n=1 Tax=Gimesia panareensis TaxID=2527978 RepID=UPI00118D5BE8|nr:hypothetical protein [Gimesia panareensis]QDU50201.1 hypothetical protein Pan110_25440 [Gimesia panareensis]